MTYDLAFIGAGNMAEAIASAIVDAKLIPSERIAAADPSADRRLLFQESLKINCVEEAGEIVAVANVALLAVKPQQVLGVLSGLKNSFNQSTLVISIAAGVSTGLIERALCFVDRPRVIRAMPNTPVLVGRGMVALAPGCHATADDLETAERLFSSSAVVMKCDEAKMDAVTAVSGSGPAYFFFLVEQMIAAGVTLGLTSAEARTLATQTAVGAAEMLQRSEKSAEELRNNVTSPGGTTAAAIESMCQAGVDKGLRNAVVAASARSAELQKILQQSADSVEK